MPEQRYHHGGLREALIGAALDLLERDGPAALSLRALARAIGVSPMAPYHHFADRAALLAAIATEGFERLQRRKVTSKATHATAREALAAGAADYVDFILTNPNLYRLMKGAEFSDRDRYPALQRAAAAPAETLIATVAILLAEHQVTHLTADHGALLLWGLAHGLGTLALDAQMPAELAAPLAREGATAMIDGWLNS